MMDFSTTESYARIDITSKRQRGEPNRSRCCCCQDLWPISSSIMRMSFTICSAGSRNPRLDWWRAEPRSWYLKTEDVT